MHTFALSTRDRRTLLFGALTVVALLVLGRALPAWWDWERNARSDAISSGHELEQALQLLEDSRLVESRLETLRARAIWAAELALDGSSSAAAEAHLADVLRRAGEESGVVMGSITVRSQSISSPTSASNDATAGDLRAIATVVLDSDIDGLTLFLGWLEQLPPLLAIRELNVTRRQQVMFGDTSESLQATVTVEGLAVVTGVDPNARKMAL